MTDANSPVLYKVIGATARVSLNRPEKRNALNSEMIAALKEFLRQADDDESIRAIILDGSGSDFCSGADLKALQKISTATVAENLDDARSLMELFLLMRKVRLPVIAAVRGKALAGGCGLATACDLILAARSSRFGYPEVRLGFVPAIVMAILRRNVSEKRAFELVALGQEIDADEAVRIGLVNRVFSDEEFADDVEEFASRFLKVSGAAVSNAKQLLYRTDALSFEDALQFGVDVNVITRMADDCRAGIERFLEKAERK